MTVTWLQMAEGQRVPWYLGYAWGTLDGGSAVYLPVPLNLVAGWVRRAWHALRCGAGSSVIDRAHANGFAAGCRFGQTMGYELGHAAGVKAGVERIEQEILTSLRTVTRLPMQ